MRLSGIKNLDPMLDSRHMEWLMVPITECPDSESESRYVVGYFRRPHGPWGGENAFVEPVAIRRSRRWVLFQQVFGTD